MDSSAWLRDTVPPPVVPLDCTTAAVEVIGGNDRPDDMAPSAAPYTHLFFTLSNSMFRLADKLGEAHKRYIWGYSVLNEVSVSFCLDLQNVLFLFALVAPLSSSPLLGVTCKIDTLIFKYYIRKMFTKGKIMQNVECEKHNAFCLFVYSC